MFLTSYKLFTLNLFYAILLAVIGQIILIQFGRWPYSGQRTADSGRTTDDKQLTVADIHPDAKSAIERATSDACKRELLNFAVKQAARHNNSLANIIDGNFRRTCNHDSQLPGENTFLALGCLTLADDFNFSSLVEIADDQLVNNSTTCSQLCFSYGHSYAGYNLTGRKCHCGDDELAQFIVAPEHNRTTNKDDCANFNQLQWFRVNVGIYQPKYQKNQQQTIIEPARKPVKIAFLLILNGRSVLQVRRLLKYIYSKHHQYYLHVDERQRFLFDQLLPLESKHDNIILAKRRYRTIWGGTTLLQMIHDAMKSMLHLQWDFMINLSESDFPLKHLSELEHYLASQPRTSIYLRTHNMKGYNFIKKQGLDQSFYQCENRVWRLGARRLPSSIIYSGGSDWFVLPRNFCDFIVGGQNIGHDDDQLVKQLLYFYNHTLLPAESFFHTLALNSKFCDNFVDNNLRVTNWRRKQACKCQHKNIVDWCGCSPSIYRWTDLKRLQQTKSSNELFFSRKFDPTLSSSIIEAVQHHLVNNISLNHQQYDTRYWLNVLEFPFEPGSQPDGSTYVQLGLFAIRQLLGTNYANFFHYELKTIDVYFNHDRFVGLIYNYCGTNLQGCLQILVERNASAHLKEYHDQCFRDQVHQIQVIEVNHGFDTGEGVFRNFMPLHSNSDIVVYHEWIVQNQLNLETNADKRVKFEWVNPGDQIELTQTAKLQISPKKPTRLSLVHRLNTKKPLISGKWNLTLYDGQIKCFDYQFLIFNQSSFDDAYLTQREFDEFYTVTHSCITGTDRYDDNTGNSTNEYLREFKPCAELDWSLLARDQRLTSYDLS